MDPKGCYSECVREYPNNYSGQSAHATCYDYCNQVNGKEPFAAYPNLIHKATVGQAHNYGTNNCKEGFASGPDGMHSLNTTPNSHSGKLNTEGWGETKAAWGNDGLTNYFNQHHQMRQPNQNHANVYDTYYHRDDYNWNDATVSPYVMEIMSKNMHMHAMPNTRRMYPGGGDKVMGVDCPHHAGHGDRASCGCATGDASSGKSAKEAFCNGDYNYNSTTISPYVQEVYRRKAAKEHIMNTPPFHLERAGAVQGVDESTDLKVINPVAGEVFNNNLIMPQEAASNDINGCHEWCDAKYQNGEIKNMACHKDCSSLNPNIKHFQIPKALTTSYEQVLPEGLDANQTVAALQDSMQNNMKGENEGNVMSFPAPIANLIQATEDNIVDPVKEVVTDTWQYASSNQNNVLFWLVVLLVGLGLWYWFNGNQATFEPTGF